MYSKNKHRSNQFQRTRNGKYQSNRFQEKQKKTDTIIDMSSKAFPTLTPTHPTPQTQDNDLSKTFLDFNKMKISNEDTPPRSPQKTVADGWVTISRKNNKIVKIYGKTKIRPTTNQLTDTQEVFKCYKILSNHWNNYRDTQNELLGESSEYWNYKTELKQLFNEERKIITEINDTGQSNSDDDDEELYNETTDVYDYY